MAKRARAFSVVSTMLIFVTVLLLLLYLFLPALYQNLTQFVALTLEYNRQLPEILDSLSSHDRWGNMFPWESLKEFIDLARLLEFLGLDDLESYTRMITGIVSGVFRFAVGVVSALYILLDRARLRRAFHRFLSVMMNEKRIGGFFNTMSLIGKTLYRFCYGQSLDAFIGAFFVGIALVILGEPNALSMALIYFLCSLVPIFGTIAGVASVGLFTLMSQGFTWHFVITMVIVLAIQQTDSNFIHPRIVGGALHIRPLAVIFGVSMGAGLFGLPGMLLGAPAMAVIFQLSRQYADAKHKPIFSRANILHEKDGANDG
jgi:predicted PurR-regulated permease PerM